MTKDMCTDMCRERQLREGAAGMRSRERPVLRAQGPQEGRGARGRRRRVHDDRATRARARRHRRARRAVPHAAALHIPVAGALHVLVSRSRSRALSASCLNYDTV